MSLRRIGIGKHSELARRLIKAGKLQARVPRPKIWRLGGQGIRIAAFEIGADRSSTLGCVHQNKSPGLAQANRRRQGGGFQ